MTDAILEQIVHCPYCGETVHAEAEIQQGAHRFIEDCPICCRPIEYVLSVATDGAWRLEAHRDDEV